MDRRGDVRQVNSRDRKDETRDAMGVVCVFNRELPEMVDVSPFFVAVAPLDGPRKPVHVKKEHA